MKRFTAPLATAALLAVALGGCATGQQLAQPQFAVGGLEARAAQSRSFEPGDARLVLKAVVNVLQDEGFVIREASAELGVVTAVKEWRSRQSNDGLRIAKWIAAPMTYGASLLIPSGRTEFTAVEASVNVTQEAARARVRISLVAKVTDRQGRVQSVRPVDDAFAYQGLLARLDKALFLQHEGL
jgi:hypothetical protein